MKWTLHLHYHGHHATWRQAGPTALKSLAVSIFFFGVLGLAINISCSGFGLGSTNIVLLEFWVWQDVRNTSFYCCGLGSQHLRLGCHPIPSATHPACSVCSLPLPHCRAPSWCPGALSPFPVCRGDCYPYPYCLAASLCGAPSTPMLFAACLRGALYPILVCSASSWSSLPLSYLQHALYPYPACIVSSQSCLPMYCKMKVPRKSVKCWEERT